MLVEADSFKDTDLIYQALSSDHAYREMLEIAEHVSINLKNGCCKDCVCQRSGYWVENC